MELGLRRGFRGDGAPAGAAKTHAFAGGRGQMNNGGCRDGTRDVDVMVWGT